MGRVLIGIAGVVGAILLLAGPSGVLAEGLAVLLGLAGLDLVATGVCGHGSLYARSHVPPSLRRP